VKSRWLQKTSIGKILNLRLASDAITPEEGIEVLDGRFGGPGCDVKQNAIADAFDSSDRFDAPREMEKGRFIDLGIERHPLASYRRHERWIFRLRRGLRRSES